MYNISLKKVALLSVSIALATSSVWANNLAAKADIVFKGSSTLHDFEGTATSQPFSAEFQENEEEGTLKVSAKSILKVESMTTDNKKRDKNMFKMFDVSHFGNIEGQLSETLISATESTEAPLHLKIRNVEQNVTATISNIQRNGSQISCNMTFPVSLKAFELKGPSVMGIIRVDDTVYVDCTITGKVNDTVAEN